MREKSFLERLPGDVLLMRQELFTCHAVILNGEEGADSRLETIVQPMLPEKKWSWNTSPYNGSKG